MKIRLELETADVREMIQDYFLAKGYEIRNLDSVCAVFEDAYPDGIMIEAYPSAEPAPARAVTTKVAEPEVVAEPVEEPAVPAKAPSADASPNRGKSNPRLSFSDLMDPTMHGMVPSRDELLQETQREIQQLLQASKSIERERTSSDD